MKKRYIAILTVLIIAALGIGAGIAILQKGMHRSSFSVSDEEIKENTVTYDDGDYYYQSQGANLLFDEDTGVDYYNNIVTAFLTEDISEQEAEELADSIEGKLIGHISGSINEIQIMVKDSSLSEIQSLSDELMKSGKVLLATYDCPMESEEATDNTDPWRTASEEDSGKNNDGDELNPEGNDWWAESIGAYSAWELVDSDILDFTPVNVGIIDNGFDAEHEDFQTDNSSKINFTTEYPNATVADHGTHVSGLVAANHNTTGIRGVADQSDLWCVNLDHFDDTSLGCSKVVNSLIAQKTKVINCSFVLQYLQSEKKFKKSDERKNYKDYDAYVEGFRNEAEHSTQICICFIANLIKNKEECLFVQAAGNGYDNAGEKGFDTDLSGYFDGIDQESFDAFLETLSDKSKMDGISYEDIKNHVIVVSGYEKGKKSSIDSGFCYGENVDLCAPGRNVYSTLTTKDDAEGNDNNGLSYGKDSGTSMAAPIVSGSAAVLWSFDNSLSAKQVKDYLLVSAFQGKSSDKDDTRETYSMLDLTSSLFNEVKGSIHLSISDEDNNPIAADSVEVKTDATDSEVFNYTYEFTNTEEGQDIWLAALGNCTITIKKEGYDTVTLNVPVKQTEDVEYGTVTLKKAVDLAGCLSAYAEKLRSYSHGVFSLAYVDDDDIPELITADETVYHMSVSDVYTYVDGEVREYSDNGTGALLGSQLGQFTYAERTGCVIATGYENAADSYEYFFTVMNGQVQAKTVFDYYWGVGTSSDGKVHYYIDNSDVTEETFKTRREEKLAEQEYRTIKPADMFTISSENIAAMQSHPEKFVAAGELYNSFGTETQDSGSGSGSSASAAFKQYSSAKPTGDHQYSYAGTTGAWEIWAGSIYDPNQGAVYSNKVIDNGDYYEIKDVSCEVPVTVDQATVKSLSVGSSITVAGTECTVKSITDGVYELDNNYQIYTNMKQDSQGKRYCDADGNYCVYKNHHLMEENEIYNGSVYINKDAAFYVNNEQTTFGQYISNIAQYNSLYTVFVPENFDGTTGRIISLTGVRTFEG